MGLTQLIDAVARRRQEFARESSEVAAEKAQYQKAADELEAKRERNGRELAGYLLPDLDDDDLGELERRLRYPVLLAEKRKIEARLAALDDERRDLEAHETWLKRDVLRVDYTTQREEIADAVASFERERAVWESSAHFRALEERGWFEPDYDGGLFDWLRDWRACSLLMAELEKGFPDREFPEDEDVKRAWEQLFARSEPVLQLSKDLTRKLEHLDALEERHRYLLGVPDELFQELWRTLAGLVVDHLRQAPDDLLVALGKDDETLATFLKKDVGLKKQAVYLRELVVARIDPYLRQLHAEERKLGAKHDKLRYKRSRGKWVPDVDRATDAARVLPHEKWSARRASFAKTRARLSSFDRYDRGSFVTDYLWWDLITRGASGDDLYEVRVFHEQHPGWSVDGFRDPLDVSDGGDDRSRAANDLAADASVDAMLASDASHQDLIDPS